MQRVPLEKRLRDASAATARWPAACWLYMGAYFKALSEMSSDPCYLDFYDYACEGGRYGNIQDTFIAQAIADAISGTYPPETGSGLIWEVLLKPFLDRNIWRPKGGKGKWTYI